MMFSFDGWFHVLFSSSDYVHESGINPENRMGPCKENYHGPNAELRLGHQAGLAVGPAARIPWVFEIWDAKNREADG